MARPRKVNTNIMNDAEPVEVKVEIPEEPVKSEAEPIEVELAEPVIIEDKVTQVTVQVVTPKQIEDAKTKLPTPICDIEELSDSDKDAIIDNRLKAILSQTQIPFIPALVRFKEPDTTAVPPMYAILDYDHRFVSEGWDFYKTNVHNPHVKDYINLIAKIMGRPHKVIPRIVAFNWE